MVNYKITKIILSMGILYIYTNQIDEITYVIFFKQKGFPSLFDPVHPNMFFVLFPFIFGLFRGFVFVYFGMVCFHLFDNPLHTFLRS